MARSLVRIIPIIGLAFVATACTNTATLQLDELTGEIPSVVIHPPYDAEYACTEHWAGQLLTLGDALGSDCFVTQVVYEKDGRAFARSYMDDGKDNRDWFSWGVPVLAPFDGTVVRVAKRKGPENEPGFPGNPPAGFVVFKNAVGEHVLIAHVDSISVEKNDIVRAGEPFAVVANNGFSRSPHVHIGAWVDSSPYQIRFDLQAKSRLRDK